MNKIKAKQLFGTYSFSDRINSMVDVYRSKQYSELRISSDVSDESKTIIPYRDVDSSDYFEDQPNDSEEDKSDEFDPDSFEVGAGGRRISNRVAGNEKVESKKRWQALLAQLSSPSNRTVKMSYREAQRFLDEAMSIPIPFNVALCSTGSSAQASEDLLAVESARITLGDFVKVCCIFNLVSDL
jgi:hypothetical protein